ncbi:MAG: HYR domain-containing protein [Bacteroidia bacterium]|nr:HYR domain-containing protein [Bacteroidia bacterium]
MSSFNQIHTIVKNATNPLASFEVQRSQAWNFRTTLFALFVLMVFASFGQAQTFSTLSSVPGASVGLPSGTAIGTGTGGVFSYTNSSWPACRYWGVPKTISGLVRGNNPSATCSGLSGVTYSDCQSNLNGGIAVFTGTTAYYSLNSACNAWVTNTVSTRLTITVTAAAGGAPLQLFEGPSNTIITQMTQNFNVRVLIEAVGPTNGCYFTNHAGSYTPVITLFNDLHTDLNYQICTEWGIGAQWNYYGLDQCTPMPTASSNPSGTTANTPSAAVNLALPGGADFIYTNSNWPSCTYYGLPKVLTSILNGAGTASCTGRASATYSECSSNLASGVAVWEGTTNYIHMNSACNGTFVTSSVPFRVTVTARTYTGNAAIPFQYYPWTNGYVLFPVSGNFRINVLIEALGPTNACYIVNHSGSWTPAVTLYNDLHTSTSNVICTSWDLPSNSTFLSENITLTAGYTITNGTINLTSSGTGPFSWTGPSSFSSSAQNPTRAYSTTTAGTYTVTTPGILGCSKSVNVVVPNCFTPPSISCPSNFTVGTSATSCNAVATYSNATATDPCGFGIASVVKTSGLNSGATFPLGGSSVVFTATGNNGVTNSCSFTVTVIDNDAPVALCKNVTVTLNASGSGSTTASAVNNNSTDNCGVTSLSLSKTSFNCSNVGNNTVTLTVGDGAGNTSTCNATVVVQDNIAPTVTCSNYTAVIGTSQSVSITPANVSTSSDNCSISSLTVSPNSFNCSNVGQVVTVTVSATDPSGNNKTCTSLVTVADPNSNCNAAPIAVCQNLTLTADAGCKANADDQDFDGGSSDPNGDPITFSVSPQGPYSLGTTAVTLTVTDSHGAFTKCNATVTVVDQTPPTITCGSNQSATANTSCQAAVPNFASAASASDNCSAASGITKTQSPAAGTLVGLGNTTVVVTATDAAGNSATCSRTFTVTDATPPTLTCTANQVVSAGTSCTSTVPNFASLATATDNCTSSGSITKTQTPAAGTTIGLGVTTVTVTATDGAGNSSTCSRTVTVNDNTPPAIVCSANQTANANASCQGTLPNFATLATVSDNCSPVGNITKTQSPAAGTTVGLGVTTVTITATDQSGNNATCTPTFTVVDNTPPVVTCPSNQTASANSNCQASLPNFATLATATDNCSNTTNISKTQSPAAGTLVGLGNTTVTVTATDQAGKSSTCTVTFTVSDVTPPVVTCPSNQTSSANASCQAGVPNFFSSATATDNCSSTGNITKSQSPSVGTLVGLGNTTVTVTATDQAGNSSTCTATFTVIDNTPPTISCPASQTIPATSGSGAVATYTAPVGADNCSGSSTSQTAGLSSGSTFPIGTTTNTFQVTDGAGNTASCSFDIVVNAAAPVIVCPADITVNNAPGLCSNTVTFAATDNVGVPPSTITYSQNPGSSFNVGTTPVLATATNAIGSSSCNFNITVLDAEAPSITCPADISVNNDPGICGSVQTIAVPNATDNCSSLTLGNGLNFDGVDDIALVAATSPINTLTLSERTIEVYFRVNDKNINTQKQVIWEEGGNANGLNLYVYDGRLYVGAYSISLGWNGDWVSTSAISSGQWHNAVLVFDGNQPVNDRIKGYLDGQLFGSTSGGTAVRFHPGANAVGGMQNNAVFHDGIDNTQLGHFFGGDIDEIRLWTVARTPTELASTNTIQLNGNEPGLTVYYPMDQGVACGSNPTVTTLLDFTSTGLNGTMSNFDLTGNLSNPCFSNWTNGSPALTSALTVVNDYTNTADASSTYPVGTTTVTYTATDEAGNSSSCTFDVVVTDNENPVITCPANQNLVATSAAGAVGTYSAPIGTDNCPGSATIQTAGLSSGSTFPIGSTTNSFQVTDASGNTASCSFTISVVGVAPAIVCPADITVNNATGLCSNTVTYAATETTGIPPSTITYSINPGATFTVGTTQVTATATNAVGSSSCTFNVTVVDNEAPAITCPADITLCADAFCQATLPDFTALGYTKLANSAQDFNGAQGFRNWQYAKAGYSNGSLVNWQQLPNFTGFVHNNPGSTLGFPQLDANGGHPDLDNLLHAVRRWTSSYNGSVNLNLQFKDRDGNCGDGVHVRVFHNNTEIWQYFNVPTTTQNFTVPVTVACGDVLDFSIDPKFDGGCDDTEFIINIEAVNGASASDNCGVTSISQSPAPLSGAILGNAQVTLTATDAAGNNGVCTFNVEVEDQTAPVAICQNVTVQLNASGNGSTSASAVDNNSTDNCGIASLSLSATAFGCNNVGNNPVTLTVTDNSGNTSTCSATVTVQDNIAPVALCQNLTLQLDAQGNASITAQDLDNGSSDACGIASLSISQSTFTCQSVTTNNVVTLTVVDNNGNSSNCTGTVSILDNVAPNAICKDITITLDNYGNASITAQDIDNGSTDACGISSYVASQTAFDCDDVDTSPNQVTLTVTDANGNSSTCTSGVTVEDQIPPLALCQDITVSLDATGNVSIAGGQVDGGSTDNCTIQFITVSPPNTFDCNNIGANVVTLAVVDVNNNYSICTANVTIEDNTPPVAICKDITVQLSSGGTVSIAGQDVDNSSTDACGIQSYTVSPSSFDCSDQGSNPVTLTVTDVNGNSSTCSASVRVEDNVDPIAICQDVTVQLDANGNASTTAQAVDNGSNDACGIVNLSLDVTSFDCSNLGANQVTLTVTDGSTTGGGGGGGGQQLDQSQTTTTTRKATLWQSFTAGVTGQLTQIDLIMHASSTTNTKNLNIYAGAGTGGTQLSGPQTLTFSTNSVFESFTLSTPIPVVAGQVYTISLVGFTSTRISYASGTNPYAGGEMDVVGGLDDLAFRTYVTTAGGSNGNSPNTATCTATVTVQDNIPPTISCPPTQNLIATSAAGATATFTNPVGSDNCPSTTAQTAGLPSGSTFPIGSTTNTFTVTDASGNTASCSFDINVVGVPPAIVCPADITVNTTAGQCDGVATYVATDPVGIPASTITYTIAPGSTFPLGSTSVTATATNSVGSSSCSFIVTVEDHEAPVALCQDLTIQLSAGTNNGDGAASITATQVDNGSNDACGIASLVLDNTSFDCSDVSTSPNTVILTVTDNNGNQSTCTAGITVEDNVPPVALCQDLTIQLSAGTNNGDGAASITPQQVDNGSSDNCSVANLALDNTSFDCSDVSTSPNTVTLTVTDVNGNQSTCTAGITVQDNVPPVAICQDLTIQLSAGTNNGDGAASITPQQVDNGSSDNCSVANLALDNTSFDCSDVSTSPNTVTLTVTDVNGNQSTCTAGITVEDNVPPVALCQDLTIQLSAGTNNGDGAASITPQQVDNGSSDNCSVANLALDNTSFDCSDVSTSPNTVTLTVTDVNGNQSTCTAGITVEDNVPPVAICQDLTIQLSAGTNNGDGAASITPQQVDNGSSDNCSVANLALDNTSFDCSDVSTSPNTVTLTVTDVNGNQSTCTAGITVQDNVPPVAICQNVTVQLNASGNGSITPQQVNNGSSDNCTVASLNLDQTTFNCSNVVSGSGPQGDLFISEYIEGSGNNKCIEIYNGTGAAVNLSGYSLLTYFNGSGSIGSTIALSGTVNNGDVFVVCNSLAGAPFLAQADQTTPGSGTASLTHNGNDAIVLTHNGTPIDIFGRIGENPGTAWTQGGNSTVDHTLVRVPSVTAGNTSNTSLFPALGTEWTQFPNNTATQLGSHTANSSNNNSNGPTVTLTVTDVNGNQSTCTATVTVLDQVPPVALCQNVTVQLDANGNGSTTASAVNNGSNDACGIQSLSLSQTSFTCSSVGANPVTLTVTDNNGNVSTCSANVQVQDNVPPVALCQNVTVQLNASGNGNTTASAVNNGSNDACGIQSLSLSQTSFNCSNVGANPVTLTVTDNNGNVSTCSANVQVEDNVPPVALCQDVTVQLDANGNGSTTANAINNGSNDACGIQSLSISNSTFDCSNVSALLQTSSLIISEYVEGSGLTKYVEIYNGTGSAVNLANYSLRLYANGSATPTTVSSLAAGGTLASGQTVVFANSGATAYTGTSFPIAAVNWNGNDAFDLFNTLTSQQVDIFGQIGVDPGTQWSVGGNVTADQTLRRRSNVTSGNTVNGAGFPTLGTEWNSFANNTVSGLGTHSLTNNVVLTVTDNNGNQSTCTAGVTVEDNIAPVALCQDLTIQLSAGTNNGDGSASITPQQVDNGSNDACGIESLALDNTSFSCGDVSTSPNTVTLTVTDVNGNQSTCTAGITVEDNIAPIALCQDITINTDSTGFVAITPQQIDNGSSDNCTVASLAVNPNTFDCNDKGQNPVVLTVTDVNGNVSTCNATVTVTNDPLVCSTTSPTFACGYNISCNGQTDGQATVSVTGGCLPYTYLWTDGQLTATAINLAAGTYSVTVTDGVGDQTTCTITLTEPAQLVDGSTIPTFACGYNVSCNGASDGSIDYSLSGGCQPYTYSWTGPNGYTFSGQDPQNIAAGTYNVTATDQNGCFVTNSFTLTEPALLNGSSVIPTYACGYNISCNGNSDGSIDYSMTGGCQPYSYSWSGPNGFTSSSQDISNLVAGTYTVTTTDANGCSLTQSFTLTQPAVMQITSLVPSVFAGGYNIGCNGGANGKITVNIAGGASCQAYTVTLSGPVSGTQTGGTPRIFTGLTAGTYTVTVTDANGCTDVSTITLTQAPPLSVDAGVDRLVILNTPFLCPTITAIPTGGVAPYSYYWFRLPSPLPFLNGQTMIDCPTTTTTYVVRIKDANSCVAFDTVVVNVIQRNAVGNPDCDTLGYKFCFYESCTDTCIRTGNLIDTLASYTILGNCLGDCENCGPCAGNMGSKFAQGQNNLGDSPLSSDLMTDGAQFQAYPNPFEEKTTLRFSLPEDQQVTIVVYDLRGELVSTLFEGSVKAHEEYEVAFQPEKVTDGVYITKLMTNTGAVYYRKLILLR